MAQDPLSAVRAELKSLFVERDEAVDGILVALLAREHVLLLGPPGTAKSMLARELVRRLEGARLFEWLLTKFSTPEELLGPPSLPALEAGRYERVTEGKLPEAEVAFLDEIFKANSAILNALLSLLAERRFHQGSRATVVPLETVIGASNELPDEEELAALFDRFLLRFTVGYVEQDQRFSTLLTAPPPPAAPQSKLTQEDLAELRGRVAEVRVPAGIIEDLVELRRSLLGEGVIASDRRWRKSVGLLKASAVLEGRDEAGPADLSWLEHILWTDPEEQPKVREIVAKISGGSDEEAKKILFQAQEIQAYARRPWPDESSRARALIEAHAKLDELRKRLERMLGEARRRSRPTRRLEAVKSEISSLQASLLGVAN
ncbi:MAG: AAA family ATPase [Myxococcota bacterium]